MKKATLRLCSICNCELILVSEITERVEGSKFPQTTTEYRCSNQECQDEKDKQTKKRMKMLADKEIADKRRAHEREQKRKQIQDEKKSHLTIG